MTTTADANTIESIEPKLVWKFFAGISAIPRASKHEEQIRVHTLQVAKELGFTAREDHVGNIVIEVPATKGYEKAPIVVLQGHLDMVCEKNAGTEHDFDRDPIRLIVDKDAKTGEQIVRADGTTLGADNGIGVAMGLAAATSPDVVHGPLELLCTIDEEMGMTGAGDLESDFFKGKLLLNLDAEEDDFIYIGCAGGGDTTLTWEFDTEPLISSVETCRVTVSGLRGGHSGGDIHENRGNANKTLTRVLMVADIDGLQIATITGGSLRNAIPREANAVVIGPAGTQAALEKAAREIRDAVMHESAEPDATITVEAVERADAVLSPADTQRLLWALTALPHGVLEMHQQVAGLVQTSNNLATIESEPLPDQAKLRVVVGNLSRSSIGGRMLTTRAQIVGVAKLAGAAVTTGSDYPGWEPDVDSPLLATCRRIYQQMFAEEPTVTAIHAGLECGIIGQRMGKLDMLSLGPRITGAHSPDEQTYVASVQKSYKYLTAILAELANS